MMNLKELRMQKNLTQQQLADILNVKRSTLGMWETGSTTPELSNLRKLSDFFNVSTDYLLNETKSNINLNNSNLSEKTIEIFNKLYLLSENLNFLNIQMSTFNLSEFKNLNEDFLNKVEEIKNLTKLLSYQDKALFICCYKEKILNMNIYMALLSDNANAFEMSLLDKFKQLDERGKNAVLDTLEREYSYIKKKWQ